MEGAQLCILGTWEFTTVALPLLLTEAFRPVLPRPPCWSQVRGTSLRTWSHGASPSPLPRILFLTGGSGLGQLESPQLGGCWLHAAPLLTWGMVLSSSPRPCCSLTSPGPAPTLALSQASAHGPPGGVSGGCLLLAAVGCECASPGVMRPRYVQPQAPGPVGPLGCAGVGASGSGQAVKAEPGQS